MSFQSSKPSHVIQLFLAVIISVFGTSLTWALDCSIENAILSSQAEVDSFQSEFGGGDVCDTLVGRLSISGDDIVSLIPLSDLTSIGGPITIEENLVLENLWRKNLQQSSWMPITAGGRL